MFKNPPSGVLRVSARKTGAILLGSYPFGLLIVRASPVPTLVDEPAPLLFFLSLSFLFFGLLIARAFPSSTLVDDPLFGCGFAYSISSQNRCRFALFVFLDRLSPASCV